MEAAQKEMHSSLMMYPMPKPSATTGPKPKRRSAWVRAAWACGCGRMVGVWVWADGGRWGAGGWCV